MSLAKWLLLFLLPASVLGLTGGCVNDRYQKVGPVLTPLPSPSMLIPPSSPPVPTPSPQAGKIKIIDGNVCLVKEGGETKILVDKNDWQAEAVESFSDVSVSPDGTKMCFLAQSLQPTWLFWANADGSNAVKVQAVAKNCVWSHNSQEIAFNNQTSDVSPVDVNVYDTQTGEIQNLTTPVNQSETIIRIYEQPEWVQEGTKIISQYTLFSITNPTSQTKGTSAINMATHEIEDY